MTKKKIEEVPEGAKGSPTGSVVTYVDPVDFTQGGEKGRAGPKVPCCYPAIVVRPTGGKYGAAMLTVFTPKGTKVVDSVRRGSGPGCYQP